MSRHITTGSNPGANTLQDVYLERYVAALRKKTGVVYPCGRKGTLPEGSGTKTRWQFFAAPAAVTANVAAEGDDPADVNFTTTSVEATLEEFGGVTPYSRLLAKASMSGTIEEIIDLLGYQSGLSIEVRTLDEVDSTSTSFDAGTQMSASALLSSVQKLVDNGCSGVAVAGGKFVFIGSTEAIFDMIGEGAPTWVQAKSRDIEAKLLSPLTEASDEGLYMTSIRLSQSIQRDTTQSPDDDKNLLIAADAFGVSSLDTNALNPQVVLTPPSEAVHVPARNRGTAAWLQYYKSKLVDSNRVVRVLSDATGIG
jgi:hypothetical protein